MAQHRRNKWNDTPIIKTKHQEDGWPRCPRCGEDKLSSLMDARERSYRPPRPRYFGYAWRCRRCSWEGYVKDPPAWPDDPPPEVTES